MVFRKVLMAGILLLCVAGLSAQNRSVDTTDIYYRALRHHLSQIDRHSLTGPFYIQGNIVVMRNIPDTVAGIALTKIHSIWKTGESTLTVTEIIPAVWRDGELRVTVSRQYYSRVKRKVYGLGQVNSTTYRIVWDGERGYLPEPVDEKGKGVQSGWVPVPQPDTTDIYYRVLADHLRSRPRGMVQYPPDPYVKRNDAVTVNIPDSIAGHSITKVGGLHGVPGRKGELRRITAVRPLQWDEGRMYIRVIESCGRMGKKKTLDISYGWTASVYRLDWDGKDGWIPVLVGRNVPVRDIYRTDY